MAFSSRRSFIRAAVGSFLSPSGWSAPSAAPFEIVTPERSGITWVHQNGMSAQRFLPETMGPGCAFLDYDNDGWMDIFLVNSGPTDFYKPEKPASHALYRNNRDGTFTDVTAKARITTTGFGMGVAAADYDNDGFCDLFVTGYRGCALYHNNGDGTFTDVTRQAGLSMPDVWATSALWFDYNNDGLLDLFVCSFVEPAGVREVLCGDNKLRRKYYCIPRLFRPTASRLFRNNGDGVFTDVTSGTAIQQALGKALGVVATDVNNDGRMDLFVANDTEANFLFMNTADGKWHEAGVAAEVAYSADGKARSGMGVDSADVDGDGWMDLFVANIDREIFSLYRNRKDGSFADAARGNELVEATRWLSGWGLKFFDFDNDGNLDLILANGHPDDMVGEYSPNVSYLEPLLLFKGRDGKLRNVTADSGEPFHRPLAARGLAVGDFDNDGRTDVLIGNNGRAPVLLRNMAGVDNHWVGIKLIGTRCNRDAVGARVTWSAGGVRRSQLKTSGGSYLSSHDPRMILGCGSSTKLDWLEVQWPGPAGATERLTGLPIDTYVSVTQDKGRTK